LTFTLLAALLLGSAAAWWAGRTPQGSGPLEALDPLPSRAEAPPSQVVEAPAAAVVDAEADDSQIGESPSEDEAVVDEVVLAAREPFLAGNLAPSGSGSARASDAGSDGVDSGTEITPPLAAAPERVVARIVEQSGDWVRRLLAIYETL
jgi:hypothetical protein